MPRADAHAEQDDRAADRRRDAHAAEETSEPTLVVGDADHACEHDADLRAARAVEIIMARRSPVADGGAAPSGHSTGAPSVGAAGGQLGPQDSAAVLGRLGGGRALDADVRRQYADALGASIPRATVHDDPAAHDLASRMGARAFTVGHDIFFARGAFAPDTTEGAHVLAHELSHVASPEQATASPTVRRSVSEAQVHKSIKMTPPGHDLVSQLETKFIAALATPGSDLKKIKARLNNPLKRPQETPVDVRAVIDAEEPDTHPPRGAQQSMVGQMGADEFFIRTGTNEVFEGGHLIGHQYFDDDSPAGVKAFAKAYANLVPMSRNANVSGCEGWKRSEEIISAKLKELRTRSDADEIEVFISVDKPSAKYDVTLEQVSRHFGVALAHPAYGAQKVQLDEWMPSNISTVVQTRQTGSDTEVPDMKENALHRFGSGEVNDAPTLIKLLQQTPIWSWLHPDLQADIATL